MGRKFSFTMPPPQSTDVLSGVVALIRRYKIRQIMYVSSFHSDNVADIYREAQRTKYVLESLCRGTVFFLPYDLIAREIISRRHKDLIGYKDLRESDWKNLLSFFSLPANIFSDGFIQVGVFLHPYMKFYAYILGYFSSLCRGGNS
ncbi:hypothetical protein [Selenomonas sp. KH1T6]|uniref:hypothetical protein n=1 Tax=Selenomonas sp. KH1T6 TaxID=3158784 RepID=UPI001114C3A9